MNAVRTITSTASQLMTPARAMRSGYIQNNVGGGDIRLSFDGTSPTASVGYLLPAGTMVWLAQVYGSSIAGLPADLKPIRAISTGANATVNVGTDDTFSTSP